MKWLPICLLLKATFTSLQNQKNYWIISTRKKVMGLLIPFGSQTWLDALSSLILPYNNFLTKCVYIFFSNGYMNRHPTGVIGFEYKVKWFFWYGIQQLLDLAFQLVPLKSSFYQFFRMNFEHGVVKPSERKLFCVYSDTV